VIAKPLLAYFFLSFMVIVRNMYYDYEHYCDCYVVEEIFLFVSIFPQDQVILNPENEGKRYIMSGSI